ncbi:hypothetical protein AAC387_Pa10g0358 [Persea americana]
MDEWHVVLDVPKKLNKDVDSYDDPLIFAARMNENTSTTTLHDEIIEDNFIGSMADDGSSGHCSSVPASTPSFIPITFGKNGQLIEQEAAQLSSLIGRLLKTYVPHIYVVWMDVPSEIEEKIWKDVSKAQRPNEPVTRLDVFLATHKRKNGSSSSPEVVRTFHF